jgi:beta-galactosidase
VDTRRNFLKAAPSLAVGASLSSAGLRARSRALPFSGEAQTQRVCLNGLWGFRLDPDKVGQTNAWYKRALTSDHWQSVTVPHTWQIAQDSAEYFGTAWYRRTFEVLEEWSNRIVRIEFEAVFHSASVWLNGNESG